MINWVWPYRLILKNVAKNTDDTFWFGAGVIFDCIRLRKVGFSSQNLKKRLQARQ